MKDFFRALRAKTEELPDRASDQRFWARFENEFGAPERRRPFWSAKRLSSAFATILVFFFLFWKVADRTAHNFQEQRTAAQILLHQEMLEHYDTLSEFDGSELDDDEWDLLLNEEANNEG